MPKSDHLAPDEIRANLKTKRIGSKILVFNSTSSTNDIAAEYAKGKENDGLVVFAEEQTAGRGRGGSKWLSEPGESLLCSIVLTESNCGAELLSLACAVAVAEAIGKQGESQAQIKWPNDIILNGKKVAGILLESKTINARTAYIIGIGINCHQKQSSFPRELQKAATSIDIESRTICDRSSLAKRLLTSVEHRLETAGQKSKKVTEQWRNLSTQLGYRITLLFDGKKFAGNCIGIDPRRGLILQLDSGSRRMFHAAQSIIVK